MCCVGCHLVAPYASSRSGTTKNVGVPDTVVDGAVLDQRVDTRLPPTAPRFSAPERRDDLSSSSHEDGPHLSVDGLRVYFSSNRPGGPGGGDIWFAERSDLTTDFTQPRPLDGANSAGYEGDPTLTADELVIVFEGDNGSGLYQLLQARRAFIDAPFERRRRLSSLEFGDYEVGDATLSPDGLVIVFASDKPGPGGGDWDLWTARRATLEAPFTNVEPIEELNTQGYEGDPSLGVIDGHTFAVFEASRGDSCGRDDLYIAFRTTSQQLFDPPQLLAAPICSSFEDGDPFLHGATRTLYFGSGRPDGGEINIYSARIEP